MARRLGSALAIVAIGLCVAASGGERTGTAVAAPPQPTVVLVLSPTWRSSPFERSAYDGLRRAVRELGVDGRGLVEGPREPLLPVLLSAARRRPDLIVTSPLDPAVLDTAALRFPDQRFLSLDVPIEQYPHRPKNVQGTFFQVEEPSYLAGYLAGLMEKRRPGRNVVSSVGGGKLPPVDRFIAGFQGGARKADPGVTVLNGYSNDFLATGKCKRLALDQIAKGAGVVFQVAGVCGFGALEAAKEQGVFGIGVDGDQSGLGPHVLTSVLKRLDVATYSSIRSLVEGRFRTGGNTVFTLANGGVGLGRISPRVPRSFVKRMDGVRRQIVAGGIHAIPTALR